MENFAGSCIRPYFEEMERLISDTKENCRGYDDLIARIEGFSTNAYLIRYLIESFREYNARSSEHDFHMIEIIDKVALLNESYLKSTNSHSCYFKSIKYIGLMAEHFLVAVDSENERTVISNKLVTLYKPIVDGARTDRVIKSIKNRKEDVDDYNNIRIRYNELKDSFGNG